ncbi:hypothetical protein FB45DRAFT_874089 [Roridomyces roridus]|uniref:Uncharacterized protein n=1 Tax=Roridomyces roridus TaxID=1738132 RepID=A0AAD7FE12_9AGAR|nr:hypothetical protein FB45DRAFT_874089 [Roridomyces roridus]
MCILPNPENPAPWLDDISQSRKMSHIFREDPETPTPSGEEGEIFPTTFREMLNRGNIYCRNAAPSVPSLEARNSFDILQETESEFPQPVWPILVHVDAKSTHIQSVASAASLSRHSGMRTLSFARTVSGWYREKRVFVDGTQTEGVQRENQSAGSDENIKKRDVQNGRRPRSPHTRLATPASRRNMGSRVRRAGGHVSKPMLVTGNEMYGREGGEKKATEGWDIHERREGVTLKLRIPLGKKPGFCQWWADAKFAHPAIAGSSKSSDAP